MTISGQILTLTQLLPSEPTRSTVYLQSVYIAIRQALMTQTLKGPCYYLGISRLDSFLLLIIRFQDPKYKWLSLYATVWPLGPAVLFSDTGRFENKLLQTQSPGPT